MRVFQPSVNAVVNLRVNITKFCFLVHADLHYSLMANVLLDDYSITLRNYYLTVPTANG